MVQAVIDDFYPICGYMKILNDLVFDKLGICDKKSAVVILKYLALQKPHDKMDQRSQVFHPSQKEARVLNLHPMPVDSISNPVNIDRVYLTQAVNEIELLFSEHVSDVALKGPQPQGCEPTDGLYQMCFCPFDGCICVTCANMHIVTGFRKFCGKINGNPFSSAEVLRNPLCYQCYFQLTLRLFILS
jgi:hypothetical protein